MLRKLLSTSMVMPKKPLSGSKNKNLATAKSEPETKQNDCVFTDKKGNVNIRILAKPGAKINQITGITEEGVGVQINAPPVDGEANKELIKFISDVLDVRKSSLSLDKGSKSRQKTLQLTSGIISAEQAMEKLKKASDK